MVTIPAIDMAATGRNITKLRQDAGLSIRRSEFNSLRVVFIAGKWNGITMRGS